MKYDGQCTNDIEDGESGLVRDKDEEGDIIDDDATTLSFRGGECSRTVSWHFKSS